MRTTTHRLALFGAIVAALALAACSSNPTATPTPRATPTPTQPSAPTATPDLSPTATPTPVPGAASIVLAPSADATLYDRGTLLAANGAGQFLFFGATNGLEARRMLLKFDVASGIPPGSRIASARLAVVIDRARGGADPSTLHRLTASWDEGPTDSDFSGEGSGIEPDPGSATWLHRSFPDLEWQNAGGDFDPAPHGSSFVVPPPRVQTVEASWGSTSDMVEDVQSWLDDPSSNFGWIVIGNEEVRQTSKRVGSRENPNEDLRPRLVVEYFPPEGPQTVDLLPAMDATIYDDPTLANGAGEWIFAGVTRQNAIRRALIAFDVAGRIPAGATIDEVSLTLTVTQSSSVDQPVTLHEALNSWNAGPADPDANEGKGIAASGEDVTWTNTGVGDAAWNTAGGDYAPAALATAQVAGIGSTATWSSAALTSLVQRWLDNPSSNLGAMLVGNESGGRSAKRFDSLENFSGFPEPKPPVLTITYTP